MNYKTRDAIQLILIQKIRELNEHIKEIGRIIPGEQNLYVITGWSDNKYHGNPNEEYRSKTIEEGITWLSKQSHPMGFSGCHYYMHLCMDLLGEMVVIKSYEAEKLARLRRAEMDYHYEDF